MWLGDRKKQRGNGRLGNEKIRMKWKTEERIIFKRV